MTTNQDQLQAEIKEKVKAGIKPSDLKRLKRSKSADDIRNIPLSPNTACPKCPELEQQLKKANDDWEIMAQKNIDYLKQWQEQQQKIKDLTKELNETVNQAVEELESKDHQKSHLRTKLSQAQNTISTLNSKLKLAQTDLNNYQRVAELKITEPFKDHNSNFWNDYTPLIFLLGVYLFSTWLLNKPYRNQNYDK